MKPNVKWNQPEEKENTRNYLIYVIFQTYIFISIRLFGKILFSLPYESASGLYWRFVGFIEWEFTSDLTSVSSDCRSDFSWFWYSDFFLSYCLPVTNHKHVTIN